ncbi:MAG TPA: ROK family protein, partial [Terriglobales bacterium]|nr:ROK family protein [Terriglobales bacterium]
MPNVLAVDLGGTKCSAAIVDRGGHILSQRTVLVDRSSASAPLVQIVQLANELADKTPQRTFVAAAIAVPGLARRTGTVWAPNIPGWQRMPLASRLKRSLRIPVFVESDRNAAILGECWRGAAQGKSDAVVLMIGTGIGAGILSGGRILRGAHELSGCAGWLTGGPRQAPPEAHTPELESLAAGPAIARAAQQRLRNGDETSLSRLNPSAITAFEVAHAARKGDRLALEVFTRAGEALGHAIANMISLLDPQIVILGGGMAGVADLYLKSLRRSMLERAQPLVSRQVEITVSKLR